MSYDIWLTIDTGAGDPATVADVGGYTSNVWEMWEKAIGHSLADFHGKTAQDCIEPLERAVAAIRNPDDAAEYQGMEPPNRWGSHAGAAKYLESLLSACREHPKATVEVSH